MVVLRAEGAGAEEAPESLAWILETDQDAASTEGHRELTEMASMAAGMAAGGGSTRALRSDHSRRGHFSEWVEH